MVNKVSISKIELADEIRRTSVVVNSSKPITNATLGITDVALNGLIDDALLRGFASDHGIGVTTGAVSSELQRIVRLRGGAPAYATWLKETRQSDDDVRVLASRVLTMQAVRQLVLQDVPTSAEYVRLLQIVVASEAEARDIVAQLAAGAEFSVTAQNKSLDAATRSTGGDLGWFFLDDTAPGALAWPEIETAAVHLPDGALAGPIRTAIGFHLIKLVGRNVRSIAPDDFARLSAATFGHWFEKLKSNAHIIRYP